jgi:hypothetical protein
MPDSKSTSSDDKNAPSTLEKAKDLVENFMEEASPFSRAAKALLKNRRSRFLDLR